MADVKAESRSPAVEKEDIANIERVLSPEMEKDFMNYDRVDAEVAKCKCLPQNVNQQYPNPIQMPLKPVSKYPQRRAKDSSA